MVYGKAVMKSSDKKPLVITEGKTDWQHLKKALGRFQAEGFYRIDTRESVLAYNL